MLRTKIKLKTKKIVILVALFIALSLAAVFAFKAFSPLFSPRKNFEFKTFSFAGRQNMMVETKTYYPASQEEIVTIGLIGNDKVYGDRYLFLGSWSGKALDRVDNASEFIPVIMNGLTGFRRRGFGNGEMRRNTDTFVFEHQGRSYSLTYATPLLNPNPLLNSFFPFSLAEAVRDLTVNDWSVLNDVPLLLPSTPASVPSTGLSQLPEFTFPKGCQSSDQSLCAFTETIKKSLAENKLDQLVSVFVLHSDICDSTEADHHWTECVGKKDGTQLFGYWVAETDSLGGFITHTSETQSQLTVALKSWYFDTRADVFQGSTNKISYANTGYIFFFNQPKNKVLAFYCTKVNDQWKVSQLEVGDYTLYQTFLRLELLNKI